MLETTVPTVTFYIYFCVLKSSDSILYPQDWSKCSKISIAHFGIIHHEVWHQKYLVFVLQNNKKCDISQNKKYCLSPCMKTISTVNFKQFLYMVKSFNSIPYPVRYTGSKNPWHISISSITKFHNKKCLIFQLQNEKKMQHFSKSKMSSYFTLVKQKHPLQ